MNFQWTPPMTAKDTRSRKQLRLFALGLLGVFLVWVVITKGLAGYLAETDPEAALRLDPGNSTALLNLIDAKLAEASDKAKAQPSQTQPSSKEKDSDQPTAHAKLLSPGARQGRRRASPQLGQARLAQRALEPRGSSRPRPVV